MNLERGPELDREARMIQNIRGKRLRCAPQKQEYPPSV